MSTVTLDLQDTLKELDSDSASKLERLVRDAMALVQSARKAAPPATEVDKNGWPVSFFEETAGCFANEPFDFPTDLPLEPVLRQAPGSGLRDETGKSGERPPKPKRSELVQP